MVETHFRELVERHQAMVFSIAYHLLHDRGAAEEVAQDVFVQLHGCLHKLSSAEHILFWLRKTTVHRAIDRARHNRALPEIALDDAAELSSDPIPGDPILQSRLRLLVASLPEKSREVVVLRFQEEMEPHEIAAVLGEPIATVKSRLQRAIGMLRDKFSQTRGEVKI
jgi:RNA polymerase sigma-70 factor (ECF subfamily)